VRGASRDDQAGVEQAARECVAISGCSPLAVALILLTHPLLSCWAAFGTTHYVAYPWAVDLNPRSPQMRGATQRQPLIVSGSKAR
jgi:hypothetical protein